MKGTAGKTSTRYFTMNTANGLCRARGLGWGRLLGAITLAGALAFALASCEQPFRVGLGQVVDAERPGVRLVNPGGGSFISGSIQEFAGESWDDLRVDGVNFRIASHPGFNDPELSGLSYEELSALDLPQGERARLLATVMAARDWQDINVLGTPHRSGNRIFRGWKHAIDTGLFMDGEIRIRLRVSDGIIRDGTKWVETEDIAFFIRNTPPAITMILPTVETWVSGDDGWGRLGGRNLNFNVAEYGLGMLGIERRVDGNAGVITGIIRDERGINMSPPAGDRFPPQFRLWEVVDDLNTDLPGLHGIERFEVGQPPGEAVLPWREFNEPNVAMLVPIGEASVQFMYIFNDSEARGRYFAFQVRAQSLPVDGMPPQDFSFPRDEWPYFGAPAFPDGTPREDWIENSFVVFQITDEEDPPVLALLRFQDIFGRNVWDPGLDGGRGDYADMPGFGNYAGDFEHEFIVDPVFNAKSGGFTLRVRVSHSIDVFEAVALWEGAGRRGRFIWDPAATPENTGGWWDTNHNMAPSFPFTRWGRRDQNSDIDGSRMRGTRNFVFTYSGIFGDPASRVPDGGFHSGVAGSYRIQEFTGGQAAWDSLLRDLTNPELAATVFSEVIDNRSFWRDDVWTGERPEDSVEGVFTIRVYARTAGGTPNAVPMMTYLTLDRGQPVLELTTLDGSAGEITVDGRSGHLVNGVIRPRLFASDARAEDSGNRVSDGYFARPDGRGAEEVMFLMVHDRYRAAVESHIGHARYNFWPHPRFVAGIWEFDLPDGVTVSRHGPVHDSIVYIQTSPSHDESEMSHRYEPLLDGLYWMYVFARDNAFNVGRESFPLQVDAGSDLPVFDFDIGLMDPSVTNPNRSADGTPHGFVHGGTVRNALRPTTNIRFRVRDDDSLNLGVRGGAASSMRITFEGSFVDAAGLIRPLSARDPGYLITIGGAGDDAQIKELFDPRASAAGPALREREGTILQSMLLDLLRANRMYRTLFGLSEGGGDGFNSLPDGLYRIRIEVSDDTGFKLRMPIPGGTGREPVDPATAYREFWIAVDNVPPSVYPNQDYLYPPNERLVTLDYFAIESDGRSGDWLGTVRDDSGPITVTGFTVSVTDATPPKHGGDAVVDVLGRVDGPGFENAPPDWVTMRRIEENQDTWEYRLQAWVNLSRFFPGIQAGNFTFTLTLEDRFGNPGTVMRRHQQDEVSPTVMLTRPMETFSRPSLGPDIGVENAGTATVPGRLANRVINFTAHAWDNFTVYGLHWWLLPVGRGVSVGTGSASPGALTDDGVVHHFFGYPAWRDDLDARPGGAVSISDGGSVIGAFGRLNAPGGTAYIDTHGMGLSDGEYVLHIIARDAHGNTSRHAGNGYRTIVQPIFLLQEEDRPYFDAGMAPVAGDVRGEHTLRITGAIMDDDGFGIGTPEARSVRIWVSREGPPPALDTSALDAWSSVSRDLTAADGLILSGRDIILNIELLEVFGSNAILYVYDPADYNPDAPNANPVPGLVRRDGTVHYVIRARDSVANKIQGPVIGTPPAPAFPQQRMSRYRAFSFTLDSLPPEIVLSSPNPGADAHDRIFPGDFGLVGSVSDVHLSTMPDGRPYILWTLNGSYPPARFPLPAGIEGEAGRNQTALIDVNMSALLAGSFGRSNSALLPHIPSAAPAWVSDFADIFTDSSRDGTYVLELSVVDRIGLADVVTLYFTIDRLPPDVTVNFPRLPDITVTVAMDAANMSQDDFDRWHNQGSLSAQDWHDWRRGWASDRALPVIFHDRITLPALTGSIVDAFSDIPLDSDGVPDITFRLNGVAVSVEWVGEGRNWRWEIQLGTPGILPDGVHTLSIINVRDRTGNPNPARTEHFAFRTDSREPLLALGGQPEYLRVLGAAARFPDGQPVFTIGGTARDANLRNVRLRLIDPHGNARHTVFVDGHVWSEELPGISMITGPVTADWVWEEAGPDTPAAWALTWTYGLSRDVYLTLTPGLIYDIEVVALDWRRGGVSEPETWTFTKDTAPPEIFFFTDTYNSNAPPIGPENPDFTHGDTPARLFSGDTQVIQGAVRDQHSDIRQGMVESRIQRWDWETSAWVGEVWTPITDENLTGGPRNRIWRTPGLGVSVTEGGLGLDDGLYRIQIRARDSSWFAGSRPELGHADTAGNPVESNWFYFYFDRNVPALALDNLPGHNVLGAADRFPGQHVFEIGGTARDANLRDVRLRVIGPGPTDGSSEVLHTVYIGRGEPTVGSGITAAWAWEAATPDISAAWVLTWTYSLGQTVFGGFPDGETFRIEAVARDWGRDGESEAGTWTFTKDAESPEIFFFTDTTHSNAPAAGPDNPDFTHGVTEARLFSGDTLVIQGAVRDRHSDIQHGMVESRIQRWDWAGLDWVGQEDWTVIAPANLTGGVRNRGWRTPNMGPYLDDGLYRIQVRARDSSWFDGSRPELGHANTSGNPVESNWFYFYFDRTAPALVLDEQPEHLRVLGAADRFPDGQPVLTVGGTARDANLRGVMLTLSGPGLAERTVFIGRDNDPLGETSDTGVGTVTAAWEWVSLPFDSGGPALGYEYTQRLVWSFDLSRTFYATLAAGYIYEIEAVALDWGRDGTSEPGTWAFMKDAATPEIFFFTDTEHSNAPDGPTNNGLTPWTVGARVFSGDTQVIQGAVRDSDSDIRQGMVQSRIQFWNWDSLGWDDLDIDGVRGWTAIIPENLTGGARNRSWRTPGLGVGGLGLGDGLYRIQIRAMDSSWFAGGTSDFSVDNGLGNPVVSEWFHFYFDRAPPSLDFAVNPPQAMSSRFGTVAVGLPPVSSGSLGFQVNASDLNRFASVTVSIYDTADPPVRVNTRTWTANDADSLLGTGLGDHNVYELTQRVFDLSVPAGTPDGMHTVVVTAVDLAGRSNTIRRGFGLDNTSPGGSFMLPDLGVALGSDPAVTISGETSDPGAAASGAYRAWFRFGLLGDGLPTADSLASYYAFNMPLGTVSPGAAENDTAGNDSYFENADSWFEMNSGAAVPNSSVNDTLPGTVRVTRGLVHNWEIQASTVDLLTFARQTDWRGVTRLSMTEGGFLEMPMWFRVVDAAGNAGYFHRVIRIDQEADRPHNRVETPADRIGTRIQPRGGAVSFGGSAEIGQPNVWIGNVLYRVWVGHPLPATGAPALPDNHADMSGIGENPATVYRMRVATPADTGMVAAELSSAVQTLLTDSGLWGAGQNHWFPATLDQLNTNMSSWNFRLNANGEITVLMNTVGTGNNARPGMGFDSVTGFPATGDAENDMLFVMVETVAINDQTAPKMSIGGAGDDGTLENPVPNRRMFYLRNTAPTISNVSVVGVTDTRNSGHGTANPHRGTFTITADLDAMEGMYITEVRILRPDEGTGLNQAVNLSGASGVDGLTLTFVGEGMRVARLVYTLDSLATTGNSINGGAWARGGGMYRVEIHVSDSTRPDPSITTLTLPIVIDNFAPVADLALRTPGSRAGTWESFQGRVLDGSLSVATTATAIGPAHAGAGIDRVYAWFESRINGDFVSHVSGTRRPNADGIGLPNVWTGRNAGIGGTATAPTVTFANEQAEGGPDNVRIPSALPTTGVGDDDGWIMRISEDTAGSSDGRDRGHQWMESVGRRVVHWMFYVDTTVLPDGPLALRYIVVDRAGNASLFEQVVVIRNHIPEINEITLHTRDARGTGIELTLGSLRLAPTANIGGFIDTGWTVRNRELGFDVRTNLGNAPLNFRLQHVTRERMELSATNLTILRNRSTVQGDNFIYLFTVDEPGPATAAAWESLGYTGLGGTPSHGAHFVPSGLAGAAAMPGTFVWVYTQGAGAINHGPVGYRYGENPVPRLSFEENDFATLTDTAARIPHFVLGETLGDSALETVRMNNRPFFLIRVWDSVMAENPPIAPNTPPGAPWTTTAWTPSPARIENEQLHAAAVLAMDVFLFDTVPPEATLHDLNPFLETGVAPGNNLTDSSRNTTIRNALNPQAAGWDAGGNYLMTNRNRGGLFNTRTVSEPARSGHIEPRGGSGIFNPMPPSWDGFDAANRNPALQSAFTVDHVSGRVILRGRATDNERVERVDLAITLAGNNPGDTDNNNSRWFPILELSGGFMQPVARPADADGNMAGFNLRVPSAGTPVLDVGVAETLDLEHGHVVEWSFLWDTELVTGGIPANGVTVHVRVTDSQEVTAATVIQRGFNVVPYITGFERQAHYRTIRSMQGWYSFYQDETGIAALGWNLGNAGTVPTLRLAHGSVATTAGVTRTTTELTLAATPARTSNRVTFDMPANAVSGRIELSVGDTTFGTGARDHNHRANISQFWNRDDHLLGDRAALWNNRLYAHVWRTRHEAGVTPRTYMGTLDQNQGLSHPGMALEFAGGAGPIASSHGRLHGAWSVFGRESVYYGRNEGISLRSNTSESDPLINPDISIFRGSIAGTGNWPNLAYIHFNDGAPAVRIRAHAGVQGGGAGILTGAGTPTNRWRNVRTSNAMASNTAVNNPGRLFTTVYDAYNRALVFVTSTGVPTTTAPNTGQTRVIIDGGEGRTISTSDATGILVHSVASGTGSVARSTDAGLFSAVGFTGTVTGTPAQGENPVVAYFDSANNTLRIAVGTGAAPTGTGFVRHYVLSPGHSLHDGSGRYVSMAIDTRVPATPVIHLAFFNQRFGALVHTSATLTGTGTLTSRFEANARVVDNVNGVGRWTDISLDHWGHPWIVYAYNDRSGNFDGIRVAYLSRVGTAGTDDNMGTNVGFTRANVCRITDGDITGWEAVQMAAPFRVAYDRLNIAAWPPARHDVAGTTPATMAAGNRPAGGGTQGRAWGAAIGYASGAGDSRFRIGYFFWPNVTFSGQ